MDIEHNVQIEFSPELLSFYYGIQFNKLEANFFPEDLYARFITSHDPQKNLKLREFSFTLQNNGAEIYRRHMSMADSKDLKKQLLQQLPVKLDVGAVYPIPPSLKGTISKDQYIPQLKEYVIDIDLSDYNNIRRCCSENNICLKCWKYIKLAVNILEDSLKNDFGFQDILWVFSGRRGIHGYACDFEAKKLRNDHRKGTLVTNINAQQLKI